MTPRRRPSPRFAGAPGGYDPYYLSDDDDGLESFDEDGYYATEADAGMRHGTRQGMRDLYEVPSGIRGRGPSGYSPFVAAPFMMPSGGAGGRYPGRMDLEGLMGRGFEGEIPRGRMRAGMMWPRYSGYGDMPPVMGDRRRGAFAGYSGHEAYDNGGFSRRGGQYGPHQEKEMIFSVMPNGMYKPEFVRRDERGRIVENWRPGACRRDGRRGEQDREADGYGDEHGGSGRGSGRNTQPPGASNHPQHDSPEGGLGEPGTGDNLSAGLEGANAAETPGGAQAAGTPEAVAGGQDAGQTAGGEAGARGFESGYGVKPANGPTNGGEPGRGNRRR
ncbi:MAG: hypothetical protein M1812_004258 [Candelaria pacifica]|nr:MAG: hypothetical protein M1812_004258 [Candelaria pacifica]